MYADTGARGGVLEPEGMVEIKFRAPELRAAMARIDPVIRSLKVWSTVPIYFNAVDSAHSRCRRNVRGCRLVCCVMPTHKMAVACSTAA
jgi:Carboxyl transferase domain